MSALLAKTRVSTGFPALITLLPGPDRRRTPGLYHYRAAYTNPDPHAPGCVASWQVFGGRAPYQIALERTEAGSLRFHCTCADAVYRGEEPGHYCKHVHGLLRFDHPAPRLEFALGG